VPARGARLLLPDRIYAHFEREEDLATLSGKLEEELERMHGILDRITDRSLVVMNESFSSTTLEDTRRLGAAILRRIGQQGALCVYVTFVDELAALDEMTVSTVAEVDSEDPTVRTFKIARRPADGLAYAAALADRHGLSSAALRKRLVQ
jgi:DNA mismatch repair ATPase MutS